MSRLDQIVRLTKGYDVVADIGTDHGYVLKKALDLGYIKKGIASELRDGPLANAKNNLKGYPVSFYLSDGFEKIDEDFDLGIIAGMGVYTIIDILKNAPEKEYILQANDKVEILREYLATNNYKIVDEYVVFDKFYYVILKVEPGFEKISPKEIYLGPKLIKKETSTPYYQNKLDVILDIYKKAPKSRRKELDILINYLKKVTNKK